MKTFFIFLFSLLILTICSSQSKLDKRISRIENGLQPNLKIQQGDSIITPYYNIEERMKELGISGVSIAVVNNGVIEWAKGYGMADSTENRKVTI